MVDYRRNVQLDYDQVKNLYDSVGWGAYTREPEKLLPMVENSWLSIAAFEGEQLVGLVRVVSDGLSVAYIQDLLVLPSHQKNGIGAELIDQVMEEVAEIRQVYLTTDADESNRYVIDFYHAKGFKPVGEWDCVTLARFL